MKPGTSIEPATSNLQSVIIKYFSLITLITILLVLPAARSRAAWLGTIAGVAYLAWHKYSVGIRLIAYLKGRTKSPFVAKRSPEYREGKQRSALANLGVVLIPLLFILVASFGLYHYKKDSADGRLLIWTVTANIIKDNPLLGVGHDRFKAHYMDYQADYFRNNPGSKYETVADDNQYAFNEALLTWSENGFIGLLLLGGIVLAVFFTPLKNFRFQVPSSKLSSEQPKTCNLKLETCNLKLETCNLKPETITRAAILAILVFGLFAYPSEILPIKMIGILCLGILSNLQVAKKLTCIEVQPETCNLKLESERSVDEATQSFEKRNRRSQTCNLNRRSTERSVVKLGIWNLKPVITFAILLITIFDYPQISKLKSAHATWKDAMGLYNYGLYEQCLTEYEKAYPVLKHNGEFLINFGKALSIAEKYPKALVILKQAKVYQGNTVLYTALGDSHKALDEYESAEQNYLQAANMALGKFYPLYLLAKLYDASGQQQKAFEMANTILNKEVKVHSTAIEEIRVEMQQILEKYAVEQAHKNDNSGIMHRQKGRDNHEPSQKTLLVTLPVAQSINHAPTTSGTTKQKGGQR